jgi:cytoskeletal protein CcmA (bactofilin family)
MNDFAKGLDGYFAEGTHISGTLKFEGTVQIDGRFEGNVKSRGKLIVGVTAEVDAEIIADELEIRGTFRGKVQVKERLILRTGGIVDAKIVTESLVIEPGAIFRGICEMPAQGTLGRREKDAETKPPAKSMEVGPGTETTENS